MNSAQTGGSPTQVESPNTRVVSDVPVQTRSERFQSTAKEDFAAVVGREPDWKLSPVQALRPLIDGELEGGRYPITFVEQPGLSVSWHPVAEQERGIAGLPEDRAAANAWESTTEVLVIELSAELASSVTIDRDDLGVSPRAAHTLVRVHPNTHAQLFLRSRGSAVLAENVEFELLQDSSLHVVTVGEWDAGSLQYAHHHALMNKSAQLTHITVSLGGDVIIVNPTAQLVGEGSEAHLFGAYFADATQHLEHRVYVHHQGPNTVSRVNYKGALHGAGARTVWIGDVLIGPGAVGTDSYEQNRNLVLSEGTRADSIPNLEIKTGDIAGAGHASATGRFDDEQLFYLQSRGIKELEARRLVVMGFLVDVVSKIADEDLRAELITTIQGKLTQTEVVA